MTGAIGATPLIHVQWDRAFRLIRSIHPPIDLFEDIADPRDWEALASVESKTNPRLMENMGRLDLVPPERRVNGARPARLAACFGSRVPSSGISISSMHAVTAPMPGIIERTWSSGPILRTCFIWSR